MASDAAMSDPVSDPLPTLLLRPPEARALLVLAHGAGAGMRHRWMEALAQALAGVGIATLRYEFPYVARGARRPDPPPVLQAAVVRAVAEAARQAPDLPLFAGGKSMGARMTTREAAAGRLPAVRGLVAFGFPLHPAGAPGVARAAHLGAVPQPMLFFQGTRDRLADPALLHTVLAPLGERVTLQVLEGADHGFAVPKRSGRTEKEILHEMAEFAAGWIDRQRFLDTVSEA